MPKKIAKITAFHGGVNDAGADTDIQDHECSIAVACDMSTIGQITAAGKLATYSGPPALDTQYATDGDGLFTFSLGYGQTGTLGDYDYIAVNAGLNIKFWDGSAGTYASAAAGSTAWTPNYVVHDGTVRISDGSYTNDTKFWGRVVPNQFPGLTSAVTSAAIVAENANCTAPVIGKIVDGATYATGSNPSINFDPNPATNGSIPAGSYAFGFTWVYDGIQESNIYRMTAADGSATTVSISDNGSLDLSEVYVLTTGLSKRITGSRIYIQNTGTSEGDWSLLVDLDFGEGYRLGLADGYTAGWVDGTTAASNKKIVLRDIDRIQAETYSTINGYAADENIDCIFKSGVVIDGIIYAGGVKQGGTTYSDRILKCALPMHGSLKVAPDVFPESNKLDVGVNDGDDIVKLHTFADRVLVFKKRALSVIAYSSQAQVDYLENTFPFMGIDHPGAAFATSRGIVFMNATGVHMYTGETIHTLTGKLESMSLNYLTNINEVVESSTEE